MQADQAGGEHAARTEAVGQATADKQEPAEREQVGVDHPREVGHREMQVPPDRRQGDVGDGVVDQEHELGDTGEQ